MPAVVALKASAGVGSIESGALLMPLLLPPSTLAHRLAGGPDLGLADNTAGAEVAGEGTLAEEAVAAM